MHQIHHRCGQLKALGLLPRMLEDLSNVVSQTYQGDVTIVPRLEGQDYAKCVPATHTAVTAAAWCRTPPRRPLRAA